ncbi:RIP metalloprotease RseP [Microbacter margulisiae]|uniref:Zinc metalloprotease n=1 Tax=Microbacter margulisiae TaxID=1350067 RepID=A0A7W5H0Z2_9PORP|nr:RIP metalloprotease RseP [Microbacter margulisiae]MBB3187038.1 regulator of sigma E protease [Microbacter margulisiae]
METFLIKAAQLILSLSILVFLHELGHFTFARIFKTRVDKFYLFFNPSFSLFRMKKINSKRYFRFFASNVPDMYQPMKDSEGNIVKDEKGKAKLEEINTNELEENDWRRHPEKTEWGIGWLPLGGYCKIAGMIDESMDTEALKKPAQSWEFRSKPAWQRLLIMVGGVVVNFLTALIIYALILFSWGQEYLPLQNARMGMQFSEVALKNGFHNGDILLAVNNKPVDEASDAIGKILIDEASTVEVLRDGKTVQLTLPSNFAQQVIGSHEKQFMAPRVPFVINKVVNETPAATAGLAKGDSVVAINGKSMYTAQDIMSFLQDNKGKTISLTFFRNGKQMTKPIAIDANGKLGVELVPFTEYFKTKHIEYGLLASIPAGIEMGVDKLTSYVKQLKFVFTKQGAKQIGGFGTIGSLFPSIWDWQSFWGLTAFLSIILAFMNILPIPALDGGHTLFLLYEIVTGRKPSDKFLEHAQMVGLILLFALLIYANGNDLLHLFIK